MSSNNKDEEHVKMILSTLRRTIERYHTKKDPVIKYTLIIDKFHVVVDILISMMMTNLKETTPEIKDEINSLISILHDDLNSLEDWIQAPIYSPDHPFFKIEMQKDLKELESLKNKQ